MRDKRWWHLALFVPVLISMLMAVSASGSAGAVGETERDRQIRRLYVAYFLREPDTAGWQYWSEIKIPVSSISTEFSTSAEFVQRYGRLSNEQFVALIYRNVLQRERDPEGARYWTSLLDQGRSRGVIMLGFSESAEFKTKTDNAVFDGRPPDPGVTTPPPDPGVTTP